MIAFGQFLLLTTVLLPTVLSITCTVCEFKLLPPHSSNCTETCEGDVCFIVVNKYFNATINAGCMLLHDGDTFESDAICQRTQYDNRCACNSGDKCNDPKAKLASYTFTDKPVLQQYQWLPQIQPPMPSVQPIYPQDSSPLPLSSGNDTMLNAENATDTSVRQELEAGITRDVEKELEKDEKSNGTNLHSDNDEDGVMTVKTTVGLNVRENTNSQDTLKPTGSSSTTAQRNFTTGLGSVEVSRLTSQFGPRTAATLHPVFQSPPEPSLNDTTTSTNVTTIQKSGNITSDGTSAADDDNSSNSFLTIIPILLMTTFSLLVL